jgi:hypothetical protein
MTAGLTLHSPRSCLPLPSCRTYYGLQPWSYPKQSTNIVREANERPFALHLPEPRSRNRSNGRAALMCPSTGSTIALPSSVDPLPEFRAPFALPSRLNGGGLRDPARGQRRGCSEHLFGWPERQWSRFLLGSEQSHGGGDPKAGCK